MPKQIIIAEQHRVAAVFSEDQIEELVVAQGSHQIGDIYLGLVENVLPGIDAAFVNIGDRERNGFIHVGDLGPLRLHRNSRSITELLHPQQKVLVQVMKEPTGSKGPRLTGNISLPGRYLVLMPFRKGVNLSRRIQSENERSRLRALAVLVKPSGMGLLVRTEAEGVAEEAIIEDLETLQNQWVTIQEEAQTTRPPALLNRDDDFIQRVLRDVFSGEVNRIVVDSAHGLKRVKQNLMAWSSGRMPQGVFIDQHRDRIPILEYFRVEAAIREALKPRVDLPSGGYVIIEPTEALTVIDVNSGSFTQSATARETVLWTNCEAATEIARQLRLRNVAGVIVVDFIDMESRRDQLQVLKHFEAALKQDKARPQIAQLTELGLVELTRKRQGQNIYELFGQTCSHCGGHGYLVQIPGLASSNSGLFSAPPMVDPTVSFSYPAPSRPQPAPVEPALWNSAEWTEEEEPESAEPSPESSSYYSGEVAVSRSPNRRRRRRPGESAGTEFSGEETTTPEFEPAPSRYRDTGESGETSRYGGRRSRAPVRPAEIIPVEMTPAQQEVYAWMGVSPLLLLPDLLDNTRNVVVNVVDPGTLPALPEDSQANSLTLERQYDEDDLDQSDRFDDDGNEDDEAIDEGDDDALDFSFPIVKTLGVEPKVEKEKAEIAPQPEAVQFSAPVPVSVPAPEPELEIEDTSRRRRRRSSALRAEQESDSSLPE
ncbi:MAG: Rne/Rng family ribonuclease [Prochlorotrichaceae cyanobacterium]